MSKQTDIRRVLAAYEAMGHTVTTVFVETEQAADAFNGFGLSVKVIDNKMPVRDKPSKYINKPRNNFKR